VTPGERGLRILAVGNMYPPHHQGGYELVWQAAMAHARTRGHEVRILVSTHRDAAVRTADEPDVHRALRWYWDWERHAFDRLPLRGRVALERGNAATLRRHLREFLPDVVMWWSMGHMSLSLIEQVRRAGLPAVFSIHNDWLAYAWTADQWIRLWRTRPPPLGSVAARLTGVPARVALEASGPLLFNSRYTLERAAQAGIDVGAARVVHPGIDEAYLDALPPRPWGWRLLYAGRIDRFKGVDTAVEAVARLPDAHLAIHGKGDPAYAQELRARVAALGIEDRVSFGAFADRDALRELYRGADAVLFPVRGEEPWGLVPLEAMGLGRPVVSTARGGTTEFVRDGENALVIGPDDPAGLVRALTRLAGDGRLRERLIAGGRQTAARHTAQRFNDETLDAVEETAALRGPRGDGRSTA
jgi:glycogen synthase